MKILTFCFIATLFWPKLSLAQKEIAKEEVLTNPRVSIEEAGCERFIEESRLDESHRPINVDEITPEPNNPIAPAGISLTEFFDYGMVHVENDLLLLLRSGQDKAVGIINGGPQSFYMHRFISGYQTTNEGSSSNGDFPKDMPDLVETENDNTQEEDERESEEKTDLSQLASRNKRS